MLEIRLQVNGEEKRLEIEPRELLADVLRDRLSLTGTHIGCDTSQCGCCTVLVDGNTVKACTMLAIQANGAAVTTIEGLADGEKLHPVQQAFSECHGLQCGFCTTGMIMATVGLLENNPEPDIESVRKGLEGNLCRCTGYINIERAVMSASDMISGDK